MDLFICHCKIHVYVHLHIYKYIYNCSDTYYVHVYYVSFQLVCLLYQLMSLILSQEHTMLRLVSTVINCLYALNGIFLTSTCKNVHLNLPITTTLGLSTD